MWMLEAETVFGEKLTPRALGIERSENLVDQFLVSDEAFAASCRACDERDRRKLVAQREKRFFSASLSIGGVHRNDPGGICMFAVHPDHRTGKRPTRSVRSRDADTKADAAFPHEIRHVKLRGLPFLEAGEVNMLAS